MEIKSGASARNIAFVCFANQMITYVYCFVNQMITTIICYFLMLRVLL